MTTQVELAQVHDQLVSSREEVASLTEQLVSSRKEVASLTEQLVSSNKEVASLTEQLVSSNKEVTSLTEQLVSSNKEVASLTEQNKLNTEKLLIHLRETEAALQSRDRDVATLDGKMQAITEHKNKVEVSCVQQVVYTHRTYARVGNVTLCLFFPLLHCRAGM